jgi:hypothetical protein
MATCLTDIITDNMVDLLVYKTMKKNIIIKVFSENWTLVVIYFGSGFPLWVSLVAFYVGQYLRP